MSFNPDPSNQAVEIYFTRRNAPANIPAISFNNTFITSSECQKHLRVVLDKKLTIDCHLEQKTLKANNGIDLINRLLKFLPRDSLLTIYNTFVRPLFTSFSQ